MFGGRGASCFEIKAIEKDADPLIGDVDFQVPIATIHISNWGVICSLCRFTEVSLLTTWGPHMGPPKDATNAGFLMSKFPIPKMFHVILVVTSQHLGIQPRKSTWNPKVKVWKMVFLFKGLFCRFHLNFRGCILVGRYIQAIPPSIYGIPSQKCFPQPRLLVILKGETSTQKIE